MGSRVVAGGLVRCGESGDGERGGGGCRRGVVRRRCRRRRAVALGRALFSRWTPLLVAWLGGLRVAACDGGLCVPTTLASVQVDFPDPSVYIFTCIYIPHTQERKNKQSDGIEKRKEKERKERKERKGKERKRRVESGTFDATRRKLTPNLHLDRRASHLAGIGVRVQTVGAAPLTVAELGPEIAGEVFDGGFGWFLGRRRRAGRCGCVLRRERFVEARRGSRPDGLLCGWRVGEAGGLGT